MSEAKQYDKSYKEQVVKLAGQIGTKKASEELKVPLFNVVWVDPGGEKRRPGYRRKTS